MKLTSRVTTAAVLFVSLARGASQCYFPSGAKSNDVPCDPDADVSMCCGSRDACLSSGMCLNSGTGPKEGTSFARGSCTDKTWGSPICPRWCRINPETANNASAWNFGNGGVQVWECIGRGYERPGAYCCESMREKTRCCQTQSAIFTLPGASIGNALAVQTYPYEEVDEVDTTPLVTTRRPTIIRATSPPETDDLFGEVTETQTTAETQPTANDPPPISSSDGFPGTPRPTTTDGGGGAAETSGAEEAAFGGLSDAAKIGLGAGIGIGAAVLIAAGLYIWHRIKTRAAIAAATAAAASSSGDSWSGGPKSELAGSSVPGTTREELGGDRRPELHTIENRPAEMYGVGGAWSTWNKSELHAHGEHSPAELAAWPVEPRQYS